METSEPALSEIREYVSRRSGTALSSQQTDRLIGAVRSRLGERSAGEYLRHLDSARGAAELADLMSVIAVHKTDLFRDEQQLSCFQRYVLRPMAARGRPLRIWSAGCATGEEVATLLILLAEERAHPASTVLGTDLSARALSQAAELSFGAEALRRVPPALRARYFREADGQFELVPELRARAAFQRHNLMDTPYPLPGCGGFDVIFCRNVLIYFTEQAFDFVVAELGARLAEGGTLVLSAAEPILRPQAALVTVRCGESFFYQRRPATLPLPVGRAVTRDLPAPPPRAQGASSRSTTGEVPVIAASPEPADPREEALRLFQLVLEWAAAGESDAETETGLRRCLYLDPHFAQARYLLGMLLEQRGALADASSEYRRALAALTEGRSQAPPFFLNNERLKVACATAMKRVGYR